MRRGAKAVDAEPQRLSGDRLAGHLQRAIANQAGAEQRRRFGIAVTFENGEDVARISDGVLGIAAVDLIAGEAWIVAEVLAAGAAVEAGAVGEAEPRHAYALTDGKASHLVG